MSVANESFWKSLQVIENFAFDEELDFLLNDEGALEMWLWKWMDNGWVDDDGKSLNHGVLWRDGTEVRLMPRWQSMLLGFELGYRRKAGECV